MRRFLLSLLAYLARAVVRRQRPTIVGVTGSVGKTSTRDAIRVVLAADRNVRSSPKNYNNEIGLPIAIIGGRAPGRSPFRWLAAIGRGIGLACVHTLRYPDILVLEYGADHPGDIAYLTRIAPPNIAVVTAVGPAHTEFFRSVERVVAEKRRLVTSIPRDGVAVLNRDMEDVYAMRDRTRARVMTYGFHAEADVRAVEDQVTYAASSASDTSRLTTHDSRLPTGIAFKVLVGGSAVPVHLRGCLGRGHVSSALAAIAVGTASGMHLVEIAHALAGYEPPPGRMAVLPGVKQTTIIDDTYNASPLAVTVAVEALVELAGERRIAVLGDMLELGPLTEHAHQHVGELIAARGIDMLVTVGEASRYIAAGARAGGMPADRVLEFRTASEAGRFVQDFLQPGDVVLVKGSQGMRMERIVEELMAEPLRARELLCRQDESWLTRA
ncbi:UDP-N-acetylmuramoyl-tripeptide--D-alanyl-D-alanine ligase [Candidatus Uhrbacteria bacterium]|nr:UDP-N-acetylmuramoyl-tripeptide--D-alanyl-D-alanine ligase [Candidatus Uhrbacteria bacterium]